MPPAVRESLYGLISVSPAVPAEWPREGAGPDSHLPRDGVSLALRAEERIWHLLGVFWSHESLPRLGDQTPPPAPDSQTKVRGRERVKAGERSVP